MRPHSERTVLHNVQALRAIAALFVVGLHMTLKHVGVDDIYGASQRPWLGIFDRIGTAGVDLFFVISGFIMLVTNWNAFGEPLAGVRFLGRRFIRVYPAYWLAMLPVLVVLIVARDRFMVSHVGVETGYVESILLLPNPHSFILTVGWTLVYEIIFYTIFAAILPLARRYVPYVLGAWFVAEIAWHFIFTNSSNFYLSFFASLYPVEFLFGAAVGLLYVHHILPSPRTMGVLAAAMVTGSLTLVEIQHLEPGNFVRLALFGLPAAMLVYAAVSLEHGRVIRAPRWLSALGDGSYAVYLWHLSLLVVIRDACLALRPAGPGAHLAILLVTLIIVLAFGQFVYRVFERPMTSALTKRFNRLFPPGARRDRVRTRASVVEAGSA